LEYTRFEKARIIGARALQVTMGAPVLLDLPKKIIDPITIATMEYEEDVVPITVRRDQPKSK
jgi:DNA-directed RNA polymerase subunit K